MRAKWRCFHCDELFTRERDAAEHFGGTQGALAACQIKGHEHGLLHVIREQEEQIARYRAEDSDIIRAMMALQAEHATELRRAEELGFSRGVRSMRTLAEKQFGQAVVV